MKIPLAVNLDIHAFSGSNVTDYEAGMTNCVVHGTGERTKTTQRPSVDITEDSTDSDHTHLNDKARGIYYWEEKSTLYLVHDNDVYKDSQLVANELSANITTGSERVTILEDANTPSLIILDAENNEGWSMATTETITQISTAGAGANDHFPTVLCHGGAILDNYLFVMDEDGYIYNSNVGAPTEFAALSFLDTERSPDKGVYIGKHHEHIVAFGTRSIEFFYNAGNATGSPLNRRQDVTHNIGCASGTAVWENGDDIYFLGSNLSGQIAVYLLRDFQVKEISNDTMSSYLTNGITRNDLRIIFNGVSVMGKSTLLVTVYSISESAISPKVTFAYDSMTGFFGFWNTNLHSMATFPLIAWTRHVGGQSGAVPSRSGQGILYNGDVITMNDRIVPVDTIGGAVFESGIFEADVFEELVNVGTNIDIVIRTGDQDGGTVNYKFQGKETIVMESTPSTQTLTIRHADEGTVTFDSGDTIDTSYVRKDIHQGGRYVKRNYQLEYSGDEQVFLENLDVDLEVGM